MASATETLERNTYEWDWGVVETQFSEPASTERPAASEIYGRSLSTIYKLGAFMVRASAHEVIDSPEAEQAKAEFYTSVEEGFGTDSELGGGLEVRDFALRPIINGRVMAMDRKTAVSDMTKSGLGCAKETAKHDERFLPQLTRSQRDHENALLVDKMVRDEEPYTTRIVISPFPEEGAAQSGDEYWRNIGYVPHLRRGFVQLYHVGKDGLLSGSLSFDGSDKTRLRELLGKYNVAVPLDETTDNWLQYAITGTLSEAAAKSLATEIADAAAGPALKKSANTVDVTREYGSMMESAFNHSYVHLCESLYRGRQTPGTSQLIAQLAHNAHHLNSRYAEALYRMRANPDQFSDDDSIVLHELLVYSTIEMMRAFHLAKKESANGGAASTKSSLTNVNYLQSLDQVAFQMVLSNYGAEGAKHNRTYSACGLSISLGEEQMNSSPQTAFAGSADSQEEKYSFNKKMYCVLCQAPPKEGANKKWCGPCGLCKLCDVKARGKAA